MAHHKRNMMVAASAMRLAYKQQQQKERKRIRLYADGSYNNQMNLGTSAFAIVEDGTLVTRGWKTYDNAQDITLVEMKAIQMGLLDIQKRYSTNIIVEVYSDSTSALNFIGGHLSKKVSKQKKQYDFALLGKEISNIGVEAEYHWIKGHKRKKQFAEHYEWHRKVDMISRKETRKKASERRKKALNQIIAQLGSDKLLREAGIEIPA